MYEEISKLLIDRLPLSEEAEPTRSDLIQAFARKIEEKFSAPLMPKRDESLALSVMMPKTAALAFDRVYRIPTLNDPVPTEIGFYGATPPEIFWWAMTIFAVTAQECGIEDPFGSKERQPDQAGENEKKNLGFLTSDLGQVFGRIPTIFYHSARERYEDPATQPTTALVSAISDIALVDEKSLSWEQVLQFRRDKSARRKYQRFIRLVSAIHQRNDASSAPGRNCG